MSKKETAVQESKATFVALDSIEVNRKWNSRNKYGPKIEGDDWMAFQNSFDRGQDTAIVLRPLDEPKDGKLYFLVSGHRRLEAIAARAQTPGVPNGHIRAEIRPMTWSEARETNMRENAAREGISAADTVYGLAQLQKDYKAEGRKPGQVEMATALGIQQGYVSRLLGVLNAFDDSDINEWRGSQKVVSLKDLESINKKHPGDAGKEERKKALRAMLGTKDGEEGDGESNGNGNGNGQKAWIDRAISMAQGVGEQIATFEFAGLVEVAKKAFDPSNAEAFAASKTVRGHVEEATDAQKKRIVTAAEKAYEKKLTALTEEEEQRAAAEKAAAEKAVEEAKNAKKGGKGKGQEASAN